MKREGFYTREGRARARREDAKSAETLDEEGARKRSEQGDAWPPGLTTQQTQPAEQGGLGICMRLSRE